MSFYSYCVTYLVKTEYLWKDVSCCFSNLYAVFLTPYGRHVNSNTAYDITTTGIQLTFIRYLQTYMTFLILVFESYMAGASVFGL
jgi:hypothetical protein